MDQETKKKAPFVYWLVTGAASFWNLMGCIVFYSAVFGREAAIKGLTEVQQEWVRTLPRWLDVVFGIAILSGVLGCVCLWLRKKTSVTLFAISLVAVLVQQIYWSFIAGGYSVMGPSEMIMPGVVVAIAISMVWFTWVAQRKGWLN